MSKRNSFLAPLLALALTMSASSARAQQLPNPYGPPISIDLARKATAQTVAEARKTNILVAIAVVDPAGELVSFEKMDGTQNASVNMAIAKARTAALYKRATKVFQDRLAAGGDGLRALKMVDVMPAAGGIPLIVDGKIVGAIGVSGGTPPQDHQRAQVGVDSLRWASIAKAGPKVLHYDGQL